MDGYFDLNPQVYDWCVRLFDRARNLLGVKIRLHHEPAQIDGGDIFLFNHFARAETFIPQFCIYQATGALSRSVAAGQFFRGNERFARLLRDVGAVPNDYPQLLSLLATDILKGRKVIIFPEGGMVKDRQVIDNIGEYSIYSRSAKGRRKHHSGAARLAVGLQIFKEAVLRKLEKSHHADIEHWAEILGLASSQLLIERARRPVTIVPANITFYPLRVEDNFLRRGADLMFGNLSPRAIEELIVEGNLFFKATDMDIRLGQPIQTDVERRWWERQLARYLAHGLPNLDAIYSRDYLTQSVFRRTAARGLNRAIHGLRDRYMREIYRAVTVNMSHLASSVILLALERGVHSLERRRLSLLIYLALKRLQGNKTVHLHRTLYNPQLYRLLIAGESIDLQNFLHAAQTARLITLDSKTLSLLEKLKQDHGFDAVRLENPIEVYANEVQPLPEVRSAVESAFIAESALTRRDLADMAVDDLLVEHDWDRHLYSKDKHRDINTRESATESGAPFVLIPTAPRRMGILLAHGFLASPAEMRPFAGRLLSEQYRCLGVRLKGHGTSPWDLRDRTWRDWLASVAHAYEILRVYCEEICLVGFSTGAALSLAFAATRPPGLKGVVACATPIKFRNRNMRFVPFLHGANQLVEWVSSYEGVVPFRPNDPEHPTINYRNMPVRGLYELTRMVTHVKDVLPEIRCPALILQGTEDHVVDPKSAEILFENLGSADKVLRWIPSRRHGILYENIGDTHAEILAFLAAHSTT